MQNWKNLHKEAGDVLGEEFWKDIAELIPNTGPRIDMYCTSSAVVVLAELPALESPDQIGIFLEGQTLVIQGEIPCPYPVTDNRIAQKERFFGQFSRRLPMPKTVSTNNLQATYTRGLLVVELQIEPSIQQTPVPIQYSDRQFRPANDS